MKSRSTVVSPPVALRALTYGSVCEIDRLPTDAYLRAVRPRRRPPLPETTSGPHDAGASGEPAVSARDARKVETREDLLDAGTKLFAEQGLDAPSLDDICARAGYTRGAFYVHFPDRESFIVAVMERAIARFVDSVLATKEGSISVLDMILALAGGASNGAYTVFADIPLHRFLAACGQSGTLHLRYIVLLMGVRTRIAEAVRADQASGVLRSGIDPLLLAGLLLAVALGVGTLASLETPFDVRAHGDALVALLGRSTREIIVHAPPRSGRRRPARS
jgi:AcrR family transcriptional regulator